MNNNYKKLVTDIEAILAQTEAKRNEIVNTGTENDPMRILLNKMQEKRVSEQPKEVKIERNDFRDLKLSLKQSILQAR